MKYRTMAVVGITAVAMLTMCTRIFAKPSKMPSGKLVSYLFTRGGGMNPKDFTIYHLRYDEKTHSPMLTVSGKCQGETITFEVGEEVFEKCRKLVEKHKLFKSRGYYEPLIMALDAPSSHFSVTFEDPYSSIDGSGDMPDFLFEGISAINSYFHSLAGDREAEGHVDRIFGEEGVSGRQWTDGYITVATPEESVNNLKLAVLQLSTPTATINDIRRMGYSHFHDGDLHYIVIHDYDNGIHRLFRSFNGKEATMRQMVQRDLASMLSGKYTDATGKTFVITADGMQGEEGKELKPLYKVTNEESAIKEYYFNNKAYSSFKFTDDGVDFYDASSSSKPKCHLKRVVEGEEFWPVVNERFLNQPMLDALSDKQFEQMNRSLRLNNNEEFSNMIWLTDIGEVNMDLLRSEEKRRNKE